MPSTLYPPVFALSNSTMIVIDIISLQEPVSQSFNLHFLCMLGINRLRESSIIIIGSGATAQNDTVEVRTRQTDFPRVLYKRPRESYGRRVYPLDEPEQLLER